jgi:hypothetical protein
MEESLTPTAKYSRKFAKTLRGDDESPRLRTPDGHGKKNWAIEGAITGTTNDAKVRISSLRHPSWYEQYIIHT